MKTLFHTAWIAALIFSLQHTETDADHDVGDILIEINATSAIFECNKPVKIRCYGKPQSFVNWWIDYSVTANTTLSAECSFIFGCKPYKNYTGRYSYTYNAISGISDLRIAPITAEDEGREYKCNTGTSKPLKASVEDVPDVNTFDLKNITTEKEITLILETYCTTKTETILTNWYSTKIDGTDLQIHNASSFNESGCSEGKCIVIGKSKQTWSFLQLEKLSNENKRQRRATVEDGRLFGVNVTYGSDTFSYPFPGRYNLKERKIDPILAAAPFLVIPVWAIIVIVIGGVIAVVVCVVFLIVCCKNIRDKVGVIIDTPTRVALLPESVTETSATLTWIPSQERTYTCIICYKCLNEDSSNNTIVKVKKKNNIYTIRDLKPGCEYVCYVYAQYRKWTSPISKTVKFMTLGRPKKPSKFGIAKCCEDSILLRWVPGNYRKYGQKFVLKKTNMKTGKDDAVIIPESISSPIPFEYHLEALSPGTEYNLILWATNLYGDSEETVPLKAITKGLPDAPKKFNFVESNETTVTVEWTPGKYRKYPQEFFILFRMEGTGDETQWSIVRVEDSRDPLIQHTITKLQEGKSYKFKLRAQNAIGHTELTDALLIETKGKPDPPSEFREVKNERTSKSITVSWVPGAYRRDTQKFVIKYRRLRQNGWNHNEIDDDGQPSMKHTIERLIAGKRYNITINAVNHTGSSETSDPLKVKTNGLLPEPPTEFICLNVTETDVQLSWKPEIYRRKQSFWLTWEQKGTLFSSIIDYDETTMSVDQSISNLAPGTIYEFFLWSFFGQLKDKKLSERSAVQVVTTKGLPEEPRNFCHLDTLLTEKTATFTWEPGCYRNYVQTFVISYYYTENNEQHLTEDTVEDTYESTIRHTVSNLEEGKQYVFSLKAENLIGFSKTSSDLIVQTKGLPEEPRNFCHLDTLLTEKTATFTWEPGCYRNYEQTFVISYYYTENNEQHLTEDTVEDTYESTIRHTVSNLEEGKQYVFSLKAENLIGFSKTSSVLNVQTKGTPEPPTDFRIIRTTPTSIIAGWTPGMYRREMQHFVINYRRATKARKLKWKTKICTVIDSEEQKINYELTELKTETEYELYIFAKNCFGPSDSTPKIKAVTEEETSDEDIE